MLRWWPRLAPAARLLVLAICVLYGVGNVAYSISTWHMPDVDAYWGAAMRLREGESLYIAHSDVDASDVYRYAPWFAWAWVPFTFLPRQTVEGAWAVSLIVASLTVV